jgi:hypothetical protein
MLDDLKRAADDVLIADLTDGMKAAIDDQLARGMPPAHLLEYVRQKTGGPHARPGGLTYLAVEAYLERAVAKAGAH